jgi:hypothetical protein
MCPRRPGGVQERRRARNREEARDAGAKRRWVGNGGMSWKTKQAAEARRSYEERRQLMRIEGAGVAIGSVECSTRGVERGRETGGGRSWGSCRKRRKMGDCVGLFCLDIICLHFGTSDLRGLVINYILQKIGLDLE